MSCTRFVHRVALRRVVRSIHAEVLIRAEGRGGCERKRCLFPEQLPPGNVSVREPRSIIDATFEYRVVPWGVIPAGGRAHSKRVCFELPRRVRAGVGLVEETSRLALDEVDATTID